MAAITVLNTALTALGTATAPPLCDWVPAGRGSEPARGAVAAEVGFGSSGSSSDCQA